MIRGPKHVCVACRQLEMGEDGKPLPPADSSLFVDAEPINTFAGRLVSKYRIARWPFVRGSLVLLESMELGSKGLRLSASVALGTHQSGKQTAAAEIDQTHERSATPSGAQSSSMLKQGLLPALILCIAAALWAIAFRLGWTNYPSFLPAFLSVAAAAFALTVLIARVHKEEAADQAPKTLNDIAVGATMALGLALGIGIFFLIPNLIAALFTRLISVHWLLNIVEGAFRICLFFGYLMLISRMENIRRIFQYHGAEHQVIHTHESGLELTPENASQFSTVHPRCGTAFLAIVLVISVVIFAFTGWPALWLRLVLRVVLLPVIAGFSYELLKWNSRRPNVVLSLLTSPGLWFQKITTQPPSRDQVEVAIAAMVGVLKIESESLSHAS